MFIGTFSNGILKIKEILILPYREQAGGKGAAGLLFSLCGILFCDRIEEIQRGTVKNCGPGGRADRSRRYTWKKETG